MKKKLLPVLIVIVCTISNCFAQSTFKDSLIFKGDVGLYEARVFKNNDYLVNSSLYYKGSTTNHFIRINSSGSVVWTKEYLLSNAYYGYTITTSDNGFLFSEPESNSIRVSKYDENGNVEWAMRYQFSEPYNITEQKIVESKDGGYYIHCNTEIKFDTYSAKRIIMRLNASGDIMWSAAYNEDVSQLENLYDHQSEVICEIPQGGVIVSQKYTPCSKDFCTGISFLWYNDKGELKTKVIYDKSGVYNFKVISGYLMATDGTSLYTVMNYFENEDKYIINKLNSSVPAVSATILRGTSQSLAHYLQSKNITVFRGSGYKLYNGQTSPTKDTCMVFKKDGSYATIMPISISSAASAIVIRQYDKNGYICPDFNKPVIDTSTGTTHISFGISGGQAKSTGTMIALPDSLTVTSTKLSATILCQGGKLQSENAIVNDNLSVKKNSVYPNPVKDVLHVYTEEATMISVTNQSGKIMFRKQVNGKADINISDLSAGVYFVKFYNTGKVEKVVVIK